MLKKALDNPISGLAPWIVFALACGPERLEEAAVLALAAAGLIFGLNRLQGDTFKPLELTDVVFFTGLVVFVAMVDEATQDWLEVWANEMSNVALVAIAVGSLVVRRPFTLPYARERVGPESWDEPDLLRVNYVVSAVWAAAFAAGAASGAYGDGILHDPDNLWTAWVLQAVPLVWAAQFSDWYPARAQARDRLARGVDSPPPPPLTELVKSFTGYRFVGACVGVVRGRGRGDHGVPVQ